MINNSTQTDELNPELVFNATYTAILVAIAKGEIDAKELAIKQLNDRGLDINGKWIGFKSK